MHITAAKTCQQCLQAGRRKYTHLLPTTSHRDNCGTTVHWRFTARASKAPSPWQKFASREDATKASAHSRAHMGSSKISHLGPSVHGFLVPCERWRLCSTTRASYCRSKEKRIKQLDRLLHRSADTAGGREIVGSHLGLCVHDLFRRRTALHDRS